MIELRGRARSDHGVAASLLLAAIGHSHDDDDEHARALAGCLLLAEGLHDLRLVRVALTSTK